VARSSKPDFFGGGGAAGETAASANVDVTVVAQQPRIGPHVAAMRANVANALGITEGQVGIKATTNEGLGFIGRGEGVAAMAVAAVEWP